MRQSGPVVPGYAYLVAGFELVSVLQHLLLLQLYFFYLLRQNLHLKEPIVDFLAQVVGQELIYGGLLVGYLA